MIYFQIIYIFYKVTVYSESKSLKQATATEFLSVDVLKYDQGFSGGNNG